MKKKEIIKKYGKKLLEEISEAGYLDGITTTIDSDGEVDIAESDIRRAIRAHQGGKVRKYELD